MSLELSRTLSSFSNLSGNVARLMDKKLVHSIVFELIPFSLNSNIMLFEFESPICNTSPFLKSLYVKLY